MFKVEECQREPAVALNTADRTTFYSIPGIVEVKNYGQENHLPYSVPRYVGMNHNYVCMKFRGKKGREDWKTFINPLILSTEGFVYVEETQHGVEGTYLVPRHPRILVAWTEAGTLKAVQQELMGMASLQFQQAIHAVNGIFISDFGLRIDDNEEYQKASDEERDKIVQAYFEALKKTYNEQLEEDANMKEYVKATEFLAEKVETDNAREGVLPKDIQDKLNAEADKADEGAKTQSTKT